MNNDQYLKKEFAKEISELSDDSLYSNDIILSDEEKRQLDIVCDYSCFYVWANGEVIWEMFMTKMELTPEPLKIRHCEAEIKSLIDTISSSNRVFYLSIFKYLKAKVDYIDDPDEQIRIFVRHFVTNNFLKEYLRNDNDILSGLPGDPFEKLNLPYFKDMLVLLTQLELIEEENRYYYRLSNNIDGITNFTKRRDKKITYQWQNNPDKELPELYSLLIDRYKLIAPETSYEQFKQIFTGQPIDSIKPIKWHQDNTSELLYFIDKLEQTNQVKHTTKADYQKMIACFVKPDGNTFQAAFKNIKTNILINLSPDKQKAIDELISNF